MLTSLSRRGTSWVVRHVTHICLIRSPKMLKLTATCPPYDHVMLMSSATSYLRGQSLATMSLLWRREKGSLGSLFLQWFHLYFLLSATLGPLKELYLLRSYETLIFWYHFAPRSSPYDIGLWNGEVLICHFEPAFNISHWGLHVPSFDIPKSLYATC